MSVFKPFKQHFREYRDLWSSRNLDESATKDVLAQWVSLALRKALSTSNIKKGFSAIGIFSLNFHAVDLHLLASEVFTAPDGEVEHGHGDDNAYAGNSIAGDDPVQVGEHAHAGDEKQGRMAAHAGNEGQAHCTPEEGGDVDIPQAGAADLEADLAEVLDCNVEHFFVDADPSN